MNNYNDEKSYVSFSSEKMINYFFDHSGYEFKNEDHRKVMYQYVYFMLFREYNDTPPELNDEYCSRSLYKYVENNFEQELERKYHEKDINSLWD
tara:strand:+ start:122 stop:403 length:282 start_codon:yes stop_codon:yes gene_type:complete